MRCLRLILGDQLSFEVSSLEDVSKTHDLLLMCEVHREATYVKHHKKKLAFLFSAMRHHAAELRAAGCTLRYVELKDAGNTGSFRSEILRALETQAFDKIIVTFPGEYRVLEELRELKATLKIPLEIRPDTRFLSTPEEFKNWARGRKQLRMEHFYRDMRRRYGILMDGPEPMGGKWNFDSDNRKPPPKNLTIPKPFAVTPDDITRDVLSLIEKSFSDHFGSLESFHYAVTREDARLALRAFIEERLARFGDYQDAMLEDEPWMFHSHISLYLNCGLLLPMDCVRAAESAYHEGKVPLNAAEGFIRQILGWREFVRGLYWMHMPEYGTLNFLGAKRPLPAFYWSAETKMNCLKQCVIETRQNAYAHHIQRLMVLGNFALLAGLSPEEVGDWYLSVYADAYDWVERPNVTGMVLFADGGLLASKPYAAGGSYISKMSNYCKSCSFDAKEKSGAKACPFNYLYWDFLARNRAHLQGNQRLSMAYNTYDKMDAEKKTSIARDSARFLAELS